jgi:hypothetical protein
MNSIVNELINHNYEDKKINKWIKIYKNTKSNRIKNKQFSKILIGAVNERKSIHNEDVVLMDIRTYTDLISEIKTLEDNLQTLIGEKNMKDILKLKPRLLI